MFKTKKLTKSYDTVVEVYHYELGAISPYLEGAAISVSTIYEYMNKLGNVQMDIHSHFINDLCMRL